MVRIMFGTTPSCFWTASKFLRTLSLVVFRSTGGIRLIAIAWLRTFADHAAIAIAHARALRQIEQLKEQLELENTYLREDVRSDAPDGIIGGSPALRNVIEQVAIVAPTTTPSRFTDRAFSRPGWIVPSMYAKRSTTREVQS